MVKVILARHMDVQAGKFDGAIRKAPWICESNGRVRAHGSTSQLPLTEVRFRGPELGGTLIELKQLTTFFVCPCGMVR